MQAELVVAEEERRKEAAVKKIFDAAAAQARTAEMDGEFSAALDALQNGRDALVAVSEEDRPTTYESILANLEVSRPHVVWTSFRSPEFCDQNHHNVQNHHKSLCARAAGGY
eukprot:SAG31_NODE_9676_length_1243_cov_1.208916_2_plen_112_part_00